METLRDVEGTMDGRRFTVPAGTPVRCLKDGLGQDCWAVRDEHDVRVITRDIHCAKYFHLWVPAEAIANPGTSGR